MKRTAAEMEGNAAADKEHTLLMRILEPVPAPSTKLCLTSIGQYLEDVCTAKGLRDGLQFLSAAYTRSEEGVVVPSVWPGHAVLREAIQTTSLLRLMIASSSDKISTLVSLLENRGHPKLLNELLVAVADDAEVRSGLLLTYSRKLKGRLLNRQMTAEFNILCRILKSDKRYKVSLVTSPCLEEVFQPAFEPKMTWMNKKKEVTSKQRPGFFLQSESLLGWVLAPSCLDAALQPPSSYTLTESGSPEWSKIRHCSQSAINGKQGTTRMKMVGAQKGMFEFVDELVKAGEEPRQAVLDWLGTMLMAAELRGKQGYVMPSGFNFWPQYGNHPIDILGHNQAPPFDRSLNNMLLLQALFSRIQGVPTSGVALNMFAVLLHLCKPIKQEKAATFSPYFVLRDDIPGLLGNWVKEARFGDSDQIEKAKELAKSDEFYSLPPADKKLFMTEIFWLTSKGIGALLLPVAKDAFHAFQGMASVFYDKDPEIASVAWREYLLAEAALKEPGFLDDLGHFVNLQFRFLCHAASGGKAALPPPEPGPEWHSLPSTILENVLDVCELYRDRQNRKSNQIAQGIYARLETEPILTTLCIVMASDDHVHDASLRGRAVKLLHRLCFAFQHWQEKLNQPPLRDHLVPCLIGAFTGVEKAIMSYYDLAYRLKYELRIPIMELFEIALKNPVHKTILTEYIKPDGAGHERFLKMMTQLINDGNSQIDEAMRTLADYRANKDKPEEAIAPRPAGQTHDEEVNDDDEGQDGEDVYRRSRMNHKEHAKKYFKLAQKTWTALWLLCKHCAPVIVKGQSGTILEQLVHTSLDAQLYNLVGAGMKNIKCTPAEFEEVAFDPKDMVRKISDMFLFLSQVSADDVMRSIGKDERYYSPELFNKAARFVQKYSLLSAEDTKAFAEFKASVIEKVSDQKAAMDNVEIPDRFLCEMMADIMSDPVMFPQSKKIVDRQTAWRTIAGSDRDPYANTPVTPADLIPQPELKAEIHRFAKDHGITLEGGNMYD